MTTGDHLWLHFTRASEWRGDATTAPNLVRGEGCHVWDADGTRYIDGLAGLYCVQIGYGWDEIADAAAAQMRTLPFEPLRPGHHHVPNTNQYRCQASATCPPCDLSCARSIEQVIQAEGPESVAAVVIEPVQNVGGCFLPPPGYLEHVREVCDRYGVLLIADEVITGFGRLGTWTGSERHGLRPDIVTFAKGVTSGYAPLGGIGFTNAIAEVLASDPKAMYLHGATWGGHPVSTAVALANLVVIEREGMLQNVQDNEGWLRAQLEELMTRHDLIGDVRGEGYFIGVELVADRATKEPLSDEQSERIMRGFVSGRLKELGLLCRTDDRDQPFIQFSPPLIAGREVLGEMVSILDQVLTEAASLV